MPDSPEVKLPGFGLPVNAVARSALERNGNDSKVVINRFPNLILDWKAKGVTLRERSMLAMIDKITDKPEWRSKVFDEEIVGKWQKEAPDGWSDHVFNYCIAELRDKAGQFEESGMVCIYDANAAVVKSDSIVSSELQESLKAAVLPLELVPDHLRDWHPGSDEKVLDLVHPSLFPLVYGRSRILPNGKVGLKSCGESCGKGVTIPHPKESETRFETNNGPWGNARTGVWSGNFQWLPCDIDLQENGEGVKITSYINNLHPAHHDDLYAAIERVIDKSIPLWDIVLQHATSDGKVRIQPEGTEHDDHYQYPRGKNRPLEDGEDESDEDWEAQHDWEKNTRVIIQPEPSAYSSKPPVPENSTVSLRRQFSEHGLQVIVKLANIHLTPEDSTYPGGSWHIEGMLNEHICATSLYYYDVENITDSHLTFRERVDSEDVVMMPAQNEYSWVEELYGFENESAAIQDIGQVLTREGRLLAFPNVMQHRVAPIQLSDPSKPGHRKILALFLVDPYIRVISTANVPPQQRDWWAKEAGKGEGRLANLPPELYERVVDAVDDFPISLDDAKEIREDLMEERKAFVDSENENMQEETFFFCEH